MSRSPSQLLYDVRARHISFCQRNVPLDFFSDCLRNEKVERSPLGSPFTSSILSLQSQRARFFLDGTRRRQFVLNAVSVELVGLLVQLMLKRCLPLMSPICGSATTCRIKAPFRVYFSTSNRLRCPQVHRQHVHVRIKGYEGCLRIIHTSIHSSTCFNFCSWPCLSAANMAPMFG